MKKIILILFILCCNRFILVAQENTVTSSLTLITTDLMRVTNNNDFRWRNVSYRVMFPSIFARQQGPCVPGQRPPKEEFDKEGNLWLVTYRDDCDGRGLYVVHKQLIQSAATTLETPASEDPQSGSGDNGSDNGGNNTGGIPWNPSQGSGVDNPPPPSGLPTDQGGGNYDPYDPNNTHAPSNDPDKNPKNPTKPQSGLDDDDDTRDCAGVKNGTAYKDSCGKCVGGTTKKQPCKKDCAGVWGGSAYKDSCQRCVEGTTHRYPCKTDCAGVLGGTAAKDSCGNCAGGTSGLVACNKIPCQTDSTISVTKSMLIAIYDSINYDKKHKKPGAAASATTLQRMDSVIKYMNMYMKDYGIDTRMRLASILSQMMAETGGFTLVYESFAYSKKTLLTKHSDLFDSSNVDKYVNCLCVFDRMYANNDDENGDEASKDGSRFRGKGFIQLTNRGSYRRFTEFYQKKYNDYTTSFLVNPDLVADNLRIAVISSLWEFCVDKKPKPFNSLKKADADNIEGVSRAINGGDNGMDKRKDGYAKAKKQLCL